MRKEKILFSDLTFGSKSTILEEAEISSEITEVMAKAGIVYPTPDIKVFKTIFAIADEENLNGCTMPYDEVQKALKTLVGKAVDLEHYRKETVGTWLDAKLVGNVIMAYGTLWVSNYEEEATEILEDFATGKLTVSFEAWGHRVDTGPYSYKLVDIHFCGGALLRHHTNPACPEAFVQEFSEKNEGKILEFAKVMTGQEITEKEEDVVEAALLVPENVIALLKEIVFPAELGEKAEESIKKTLAHLEPTKVKETLEWLGVTIESVNKKITERALELKQINEEDGGTNSMSEEIKKTMEEELAELKAKVESLEEEKTAAEQLLSEATVKAEEQEATVTKLTKDVEDAKVHEDEIQAKLDEFLAVEEEARRKEMEEVAKARREYLQAEEDVTDEDLLDDSKYNLMKAEKERDDAVEALKSAQKALEVSSVIDPTDTRPEWKIKQDQVAKKWKQ